MQTELPAPTGQLPAVPGASWGVAFLNDQGEVVASATAKAGAHPDSEESKREVQALCAWWDAQKGQVKKHGDQQ